MLLHPFPFARGIWSRLTDVLATGHRVLAVDARGFGESPLGEQGYAIADLADDLAALLDQLGIKRAAVLGMSMGGYTALAFAVRHPSRLDGAGPLRHAGRRRQRRDPEGARRRHRPHQGHRVRGLTSTAAWRGCSPARRRRRWSPSCAPAPRRGAASLIAGIEALRDRVDRTTELDAIRVPTLAIRGSDDQVTPADDMQQMAAAIAGATFVTIPGAGHLSHIEAPEAFERALTPFLATALERRKGEDR